LIKVTLIEAISDEKYEKICRKLNIHLCILWFNVFFHNCIY